MVCSNIRVPAEITNFIAHIGSDRPQRAAPSSHIPDISHLDVHSIRSPDNKLQSDQIIQKPQPLEE